METRKIDMAKKLARGTALAALLTIPCVALIAAAVVFCGLEEAAVGVCNQLSKALCVCAGTWAAVGRGGRRGLLTGAAVGSLYMLAGCGLWCALENTAAAWNTFGVELLFGTIIGAAAGATLANLRPAKRRHRAAA